MNLVFASGFLVPQRILGVDALIKNRAARLAEQIQARFPEGKVHIIAHSMGGLDSRYLLSKNLLGLDGRVASLSTVSTPHRGSPVADLVLGLLPEIDGKVVRSALDHFASIQSGAL